MLFAQIERRGCLPFEVSLHHQPLMNATDQATEWTEALGEYSKGATAFREGRGVNVKSRKSKVEKIESRRRNQQSEVRGRPNSPTGKGKMKNDE